MIQLIQNKITTETWKGKISTGGKMLSSDCPPTWTRSRRPLTRWTPGPRQQCYWSAFLQNIVLTFGINVGTVNVCLRPCAACLQEFETGFWIISLLLAFQLQILIELDLWPEFPDWLHLDATFWFKVNIATLKSCVSQKESCFWSIFSRYVALKFLSSLCLNPSLHPFRTFLRIREIREYANESVCVECDGQCELADDDSLTCHGPVSLLRLRWWHCNLFLVNKVSVNYNFIDQPKRNKAKTKWLCSCFM